MSELPLLLADALQTLRWLPCPCVVLDRNGVVMEANAKAQSLLALDPEHADTTPLWDPTQGGGQAIFRRGERVICAHTVPVHDGAGAVAGALALLNDTTELATTKQALTERNVSFRHLFENHPYPMWVMDPDTLQILEVNEATLARYGYTRQEFMEMRGADLRLEEEVPLLAQTVRSLQPGWHDQGVCRHRMRDGTTIDVEVVAHPLQYKDRKALLVLAHDVTERTRARAELTELQQRMRTVLENSNIAVFAVDKSGTFMLAEGRALEEIGISSGDLVGKSVPDLFGTSSQIIEPLRVVLAGREFSGVIRIPAGLPGGGHTYDVQCDPLRDARGQIIGATGIAIDVTQRALATEALRETQATLQTVITNAPLVLFAIDRAGVFTLSEGRGLEALGLRPGEVVGRSAFEVYRDVPQILHNLRCALAGEVVSDIVEVLGGPGAGLVFSSRYTPLRDRDEQVTGVIGVAADITDRKLAEEEKGQALLRERAARVEAEEAHWRASFLAEASRLLASSLDQPTTLASLARLALPHFADWCAVDVVEGDGRVRRVAVAHVDPALTERAKRLETVYPPDPAAMRGVHRVLRTIQSQYHPTADDVSLLALTQDSEHLTIIQELGLASSMIVPMVARFRTLGAITLVSARSSRSYGPADLALAEDLARRCALAVDNARLFAEANEAVRARDEFLSIASHELRTPLTSLLLQVQYLLDAAHQRTGVPPVNMGEMLERAERHIQRLAKLVDNLLDISRIAARRLDLEPETMSLSTAVHEVVAHHAEEIHRARCSISLDLDERAVGTWDPVRIEQVVTNLLSNALRYGPGKPIDIEVSARDGVARLVVRDYGIGIAEESRERIFDRFERAVSAMNFGGLGLGLYIVRQIVVAHGGSISVRSELGKGSTFTVELPLPAP